MVLERCLNGPNEAWNALNHSFESYKSMHWTLLFYFSICYYGCRIRIEKYSCATRSCREHHGSIHHKVILFCQILYVFRSVSGLFITVSWISTILYFPLSNFVRYSHNLEVMPLMFLEMTSGHQFILITSIFRFPLPPQETDVRLSDWFLTMTVQ